MLRPPPEDPDAWTEEEWLEWLAEVDASSPPDAPGYPRRRPRSVGATMLGAAMVGLHTAIYGEQQADIVMVVEADGDPHDPEHLEVHLDPDDPDASTVTVRPWLEDDGHE
ncbi:MAG: hypothetical protein ACYDH6_23580 [Acidimicrobiales bacterium]